MAGGRETPGSDLYELLGVDRSAHQEEIARAWRRQALAAHPDTRTGQDLDGAATDRFRALAGAYHVLSDPGRRAAYDRSLAVGREGDARPHAITIPVRLVSPDEAEPGPMPGPPLRAGPVRVEPLPGYQSADEDDVRLAVLADLALRWLARGRDSRW